MGERDDTPALDALRRDVATYRALALAALDSLAAVTQTVATRDATIAGLREELRRVTRERVQG